MLQRLFADPSVALYSQKIPLAEVLVSLRLFSSLQIFLHLVVKLHLTKRLPALTMRKILSSIVSSPEMPHLTSVFRGEAID